MTVESVELGELPLFAFAELANGGEAEQIVITFEREGSSETVGHVELAVPAETQRWRTWGKTNLISQARSLERGAARSKRQGARAHAVRGDRRVSEHSWRCSEPPIRC